jgi:uncharacterized protein
MSSEEVRFDSGGYTIAGTFTDVTAPVAAALLITGSGRLNRDSDVRLLRTGVTKEVAGALAGARVATLRYDKRGVGASGGDYLRTGMADNLADARAGLGWLAARAAGLPLLVVGHSEGTYYAAELAAADAAWPASCCWACRPGPVSRWSGGRSRCSRPGCRGRPG